MSAIISNSGFSMRAYQLIPNSWKPRSEYMVTLGYFITLGRLWFLDVSSNYWSQGDAGTCCPCWRTFKGNHCYAYSFFFWTTSFLPWIRFQISHQHFLCWQHYKFRDNCSLGHHWLLLVNSAPCICFSSTKKPGKNGLWGPGEFHRQRWGVALCQPLLKL